MLAAGGDRGVVLGGGHRLFLFESLDSIAGGGVREVCGESGNVVRGQKLAAEEQEEAAGGSMARSWAGVEEKKAETSCSASWTAVACLVPSSNRREGGGASRGEPVGFILKLT